MDMPNNNTHIEETVKAVINTLNQVEVSGRANLDRLLGSIVALENVYKDLTRKEDEAE
jgi:hypothetical protein